MSRMFKCDRCSGVFESWSHVVELPPQGWSQRSKTAELCNECYETWEKIISKFMRDK